MNFNYDWILPGRLAQGSFPGESASLWRSWDVIVYCAEELQPSSEAPQGKYSYGFPIDDDFYRPLPHEVADLGWEMAGMLAEHLRMGRRVLVTCAMGVNRSGLISAMTLMRLNGMPGSAAIDLIRARRISGEQQALSNPMFESYLRHAR